MPKYDVAHIKVQGVDLIIIPVNSRFEHLSSGEQRKLASELQMRAQEARLSGTVVPVWLNLRRLNCLAPPSIQPYLRNMTLASVKRNINKTLYW